MKWKRMRLASEETTEEVAQVSGMCTELGLHCPGTRKTIFNLCNRHDLQTSYCSVSQNYCLNHDYCNEYLARNNPTADAPGLT